MNKKVILSVLVFIFLLIVTPWVQSMFFMGQTQGKMVINRPIDAPFLPKTTKKFAVIFFGYVGCQKVCSPLLKKLNDLYCDPSFDRVRGSVDVYFVNLIPEMEPKGVEEFAKAFNPDFQGIYVPHKALMRIDRQFALFFSKGLNDPQEMNHSDHLYLVERGDDGSVILKNIYSTHPLNPKQIRRDIETLQGNRI